MTVLPVIVDSTCGFTFSVLISYKDIKGSSYFPITSFSEIVVLFIGYYFIIYEVKTSFTTTEIQ